MTSRFGGLFLLNNNITNEIAFNYLFDIINASLFGEKIYPTIGEKAALYLFNIIQNHIFNDGCHRAGLGAALLFIEKNGYALNADVNDLNLIELAQSIDIDGATFENIAQWFNDHIHLISV